MSYCYAMVTGILTDFKAFFWAVSPVLLPEFACRLKTPNLLRQYLTKQRRATDLLGPGSPSKGLEELQKGHSFDRQCSAQN